MAISDPAAQRTQRHSPHKNECGSHAVPIVPISKTTPPVGLASFLLQIVNDLSDMWKALSFPSFVFHTQPTDTALDFSMDVAVGAIYESAGSIIE